MTVSPTVQTAQQLYDRIGTELYTTPNADVIADIVASIPSIGGGGALIIPKLGTQGFNGTSFIEDTEWRFPITPPYSYTFRLQAFLNGQDGGATEARLGIRLASGNTAYIDMPDGTVVPLDDASEFAAFTVDPSADARTSTGTRTGRIDVVTEDEAIFGWSASDAGSFLISQGPVLEVFRMVD